VQPLLINMNRSKMTLLAVAVLAIGACGRKSDGAADSAIPVAPGDPAAPGTAATWSDANIFALLDEVNVGDSTHGAIAATKGTSSAIRDFGKQMMRDHHSLRVQGEALAKRLAITPAAPAGDNLPADAQKATDLLNTTTKGKDFDKAYVDHEVEMHKRVLEIVTQAMSAAQSTELKNMIQKAAPTLQAHLDKVQAIQKSMQ
jgi:putative membrane protein